ncbi:hypothetical protein ACFLZD_01415 [Candidatus Neomarinimicrobiota bacterium]
MIIRPIITGFFIILFIWSCGASQSANPQEDIIGKWETNDKNLTLEFTDGGKVNSVKQSKHIINESTSDQIFVDEMHIIGVWEFNLATWEVKIYGDKMTLVRDDGEKLKLNKIE